MKGSSVWAIRIRGSLSKRQWRLLIGSLFVGLALIVLAWRMGADAASISLQIGAAIALVGVILVFESVWVGEVQANVAREGARVDELEREAIREQVSPIPARRGSSPEKDQLIENGWFVSFTASLRPMGADDFDYYTAYGEILDVVPATDEVDESVRVGWRDELDLPAEVPFWLVQAPRVRHRNADGTFTRVQNDGLRAPSVGSVVVGPGWAVHRSAPHRIVRHRANELDEEGRRAFEELADPSRYLPT